MQKEACQLALGKAHLTAGAIRYLFGGDLLRQGVATSLGAEQLQIPMFGLYGACSTSGEALALASMCVAAGYGELMLVVTSSHFGSAEKEFRFPLSYANQRPLSAQWTVTGSGAFISILYAWRYLSIVLSTISCGSVQSFPGLISASHGQTVCQRMAVHDLVHNLLPARNGSCPVSASHHR